MFPPYTIQSKQINDFTTGINQEEKPNDFLEIIWEWSQKYTINIRSFEVIFKQYLMRRIDISGEIGEI